MRDFRQLVVWGKAHQLALAVYRSTASFPGPERYGLTSQMQRAAVSISANIAEGCGRDSKGDFRRFLQIAMGSANELDCHLLLAHDLGYLAPAAYTPQCQAVDEIKRMLRALIATLATEPRAGRTPPPG